MSIQTNTNNGGEDEYEWEGGPLEPEPQDQPDTGGLDEQLKSLEADEGFEEPEIADEGISPAAPFEEPLESALQTLEENEPFEQPTQAPVGALELPSEPTAGVDASIPEEDVPVPPATLQGFYEAGGKSDGRMGELPGMPRASEDPMQGISTFLNAGMSMSRAQSDMLIDHGSQLDHLTEAIGRARL